MEHSYDIIKIEVEETKHGEYTTLIQRDGGKYIFRNLPKEFFDNRVRYDGELNIRFVNEADVRDKEL